MTDHQAERERVAREWWLETLEQLQQQRPPCSTKFEEFQLLGEIMVKRTASLIVAREAAILDEISNYARDHDEVATAWWCLQEAKERRP